MLRVVYEALSIVDTCSSSYNLCRFTQVACYVWSTVYRRYMKLVIYSMSCNTCRVLCMKHCVSLAHDARHIFYVVQHILRVVYEAMCVVSAYSSPYNLFCVTHVACCVWRTVYRWRMLRVACHLMRGVICGDYFQANMWSLANMFYLFLHLINFHIETTKHTINKAHLRTKSSTALLQNNN